MNQQINLTSTTKFVINDSVFHSNVEQEKVILSLKSGAYYALKGVGSAIWDLLESKSFEEIRDALVEKYEVGSEQCEQDLREIIHDFINADLISISNS